MPTQSFDLTRDQWILLSSGPCLVENPSTYRRFAVRVADNEPTLNDDAFHFVNPGEEFEHEDASNLYGRALSERAKAVVSSDDSFWVVGQELLLSRVSPFSLSQALWQQIVAEAEASRAKIVFDKDTQIEGDLLVTSPVHIVIPSQTVVSFTGSPMFSHGVQTSDRSEYFAGMFTFRPGAEGAVFEAWGELNAGNSLGSTVEGASVNSAAAVLVSLDLPEGATRNAVRFVGEPHISDAYGPCTAIRTSTIGYPWGIQGFMGPSPTPPAIWDDPDIIYPSE